MRFNKTFARRIGKSLSNTSKQALDHDLPKVRYSVEKLNQTKYNKVFLEIGYGMGEHFINQTNNNLHNLYIGVEVYLNGVASVLKKLSDHEHDNYMLWADDLDLMLQDMPNNSLDGIYVLFPDPWHKTRYLKKRLFNAQRINMFKEKLKIAGEIHFASDIKDYFTQAQSILQNDPVFTITKDNFLIPHPGYVQTKYHAKAIAEGREAQFISAIYRK